MGFISTYCTFCGCPSDRNTRCVNGRCDECHTNVCAPVNTRGPAHGRGQPDRYTRAGVQIAQQSRARGAKVAARAPTVGSATPDTAQYVYFCVNGFECRVLRDQSAYAALDFTELHVERYEGGGTWATTESTALCEIAAETLRMRK